MGNNQTARSSILGKIAGLFREYNKIAAQQGVSISQLAKSLPNAPCLKAPDANDGMLGSLILEQLLMPAFSQAAADYLVNTSGSSISGAVMAIDVAEAADIFENSRKAPLQYAADESRYKKGAGKGTDALLFSNTKKSTIANIFGHDGQGFFTSPFNSKAQNRIESSLINASEQLMGLERFAVASL